MEFFLKKQLYQITQSSYFIAAKTKGIIWKQTAYK